MLIQVGDHEILYSDAEALYARLRQAGVPARLEVSEGMWHVFQMFPIRKAAARHGGRHVFSFGAVTGPKPRRMKNKLWRMAGNVIQWA